jgi:uncharacterized alpha-E superfamily protein
MLSRVADSIYWMNRYLERVEQITRFTEVHVHLVMDLPPDFQEPWIPLLEFAGDEALFQQLYSDVLPESVIHFLVFDRRNPNSILSCLQEARENARTIRDRISTEMWEQINHLYHHVNQPQPKRGWRDEDLLPFFNHILLASYGLAGMAQHTLLRSTEWYIAKMGRHIERADQLTRLMMVKYNRMNTLGKSTATSLDFVQWTAVLRSMSGYEMYKREYQILSPSKIAEFLLHNTRFPGSLRYNVMRLRKSIYSMTGHDADSPVQPVEIAVNRLYKDIEESSTQALMVGLSSIQDELAAIGDMTHTLFYTTIQKL